ncbi:hypothetical protein Hanom_Chr14g01263861 [Helianthus anomalus]
MKVVFYQFTFSETLHISQWQHHNNTRKPDNTFFLTGNESFKWAIGEIHHIEYTRLRTRENPHLGPKPVNTRQNARQCGEIKLAQFKDRTSDLHLFA